MLISSKLDKLKYPANILLKKDEKNNLKKDSIVKTDIIYNIHSSEIIFKVGIVDLDKIEEFRKNFKKNN